jgi:SNF2 family DNA or RNA helicase
MLEILQTQVDDKPVKTIIFSQFTTMLDLIEPFLRDHNLPYGRCNPPPNFSLF